MIHPYLGTAIVAEGLNLKKTKKTTRFEIHSFTAYTSLCAYLVCLRQNNLNISQSFSVNISKCPQNIIFNLIHVIN